MKTLLPNGIEGGPGDDGVHRHAFNGSLGVNFGADGGKSIAFLTSGQPNLTSHGLTVESPWMAQSDPKTGETGRLHRRDRNPANRVFTVTVTSLEDGGD